MNTEFKREVYLSQAAFRLLQGAAWFRNETPDTLAESLLMDTLLAQNPEIAADCEQLATDQAALRERHKKRILDRAKL